MPSLKDEHQQFIDELSSKPIVNGYIYIGDGGLDPELNALTLYSDRALSTPISNPQRTDASGRAENKIWLADGPYSIKVTDSAGVQKLYELDNGPAIEVTEGSLVEDKGANYTTVVDDHTNTINATAAITVSLGDAGTIGAGYEVTVKNSHTAAITVDLDTAADSLDGTVAGSLSIPPNTSRVFTTNSDVDGYLTLAGEDLVVKSAGSGVDFSINTGAAGETSSLLDWYEEGTWSPILTDASQSDAEGQTASPQIGEYVRIGRMVTLTWDFTMTSIGTMTASDGARIINLPFTCSANDYPIYIGHAAGLAVPVAGQVVAGHVLASTSIIRLKLWDSTAGLTDCLVQEISGDGRLVGSCTYMV